MNEKNQGLTNEELHLLQECYEHLDEDQLAELEAVAHDIVLTEMNSSKAAEVALPLLVKTMMHQMTVSMGNKQ